MRKMSVAQLCKKFGQDNYPRVFGTLGQLCFDVKVSDSEAIERYARHGGEAHAIVRCVPSKTLGYLCYRGWIDDTKYRWDPTDPESMRYERLPRATRGKRTLPPGVMDVEDADIIITDPTYILNDENWEKLLCALPEGRVRPKREKLQGMDMVLASTIYGDWLCKLTGNSGGKPHDFGKFTADTGMVCIATPISALSEEKLKKIPDMCYTKIPKFTGRVRIVHRGNVCHVMGEGRSLGTEIWFKSVQIG